VILLPVLAGAALAGLGARGRGSPAVRVTPAAAAAPSVPMTVPSVEAPLSAPVEASTQHGTASLSLPALAPLAAGPVKSVQATVTSSCSTGTRCAVDLAVSFRAATKPVTYAWKLVVFDRCTGVTTDAAAGGMVVPAGWTHIVQRSNVVVPDGLGAPAILGLTTAPASVQSAPVYVGAAAC
jgi:hypothetical protein